MSKITSPNINIKQRSRIRLHMIPHFVFEFEFKITLSFIKIKNINEKGTKRIEATKNKIVANIATGIYSKCRIIKFSFSDLQDITMGAKKAYIKFNGTREDIKDE